MAGFKKIIVAVDGSPGSLHALEEALRLGASRIIAVAVAPEVPTGAAREPGAEPPAWLARPYEEALAAARELARAAAVELETILTAGDPQRRILEQAASLDADLVVMGLRGPDLPEAAIMGSTTARVIGYSPRDVLVIGPGATLGLSRVLLATDGSRHSQPALARALEVCRDYGAILQVVAALDIPEGFAQEAPEVMVEILARVHAYMGEARHRATLRGLICQEWVRRGPAYQVITGVAQTAQTGLIIMGSHGRTGIKRVLMGSVAEKVLGLAPCPVLVVKSGTAAEAEG